MTQAGLTPVQQKAFEAICRFTAAHGHTPTFDEIAAALGSSSRSRIHHLVVALEERGYITRLPKRARSIAIVAPATAPLPISRQLQAKLEAYCRLKGETVEAIVHDAIAHWLDQEEGAVAA